MVADTDNNGQEDVTQPEVSGEEPMGNEEFFTQDETPLPSLEPEGQDNPPQGSSVGKKIMTGLGIIIVAIAVSMYLTHKQKVKEAAQEGTPPSKMAAITPPESIPTTNNTAPTPAAPTPTPLKDKEVKAPTADNASLAAAISKSVSAPEPSKTESPLTAEISKSVSTTIEATPKGVTTTTESASKTVSATPDTASKTVNDTPDAASKTMSATPDTASKIAIAAPELASNSGSTSETNSNNVSSSAAPSMAESIGRIDGLDAKTSDLSTRLDSLNKAIVVLNKTVESMEKKLTAPVIVAQTVKNPLVSLVPAQNKRPAHRRAIYREHHSAVVYPTRSVLYVVRAIVPGRAWIENAMGDGVITVMEGDRIPGNGIVTNVDAENGEVTMDTGDVIKYGTDDH